MLIRIRVQPRSSRNEVIGREEGIWRVRLTAPPVDGAANKACIELMADRLGVKRSQVRLVSGEKSRDKVIEADGIAPEEVERRLAGSPVKNESEARRAKANRPGTRPRV
jgi:uncharacterized protein (TIGR00251 family)